MAIVPEFIRKMFPEVDFDDDGDLEATPDDDEVGWDPDCPWEEDEDRAAGGVGQLKVVG